jgi:hypothetical protein
MMVVMAVVITAVAEKVDNWYDAKELLEEYATENNMNWWLEDHYEESIETKFSLLTADKAYVKENYGFDFDKDSIEDFEKLYEKEWLEQLNIQVDVKVCITDIYKDNNIYELLITSEEDMSPERDEITKCGRALFIVY